METVALHLENEAIRRLDTDERDSFGRSAFNRYYYATFLKIQIALRKKRPAWAKGGHSQLPRALREDIVKELKSNFERSKKIGDSEMTRLCAEAISAARELAKILTEGYAVRVTADYFPEVEVCFTPDDSFRLNAISVHHAHSWPTKASGFVAALERAWRQIDAQ